MSVKIKNTAYDRDKLHLHRTASKFITEPTIGNVRLTRGMTTEITDEQYERMKDMLHSWEKKGMIEIFLPAGAEQTGDLHKDGSTLNEWTEKTKPTEPRAGASVNVDDVVVGASASEKPLIAEQLAGEKMASEPPPPPASQTETSEGAKKGPGKKKLF